MPLLRKTGIRTPWLPAPLQGGVDPLRQVLVIGALVPSLLLGGNAQAIGRPAPPEDVSRAARLAIVLSVPAPPPSAVSWLPRPLPSGEVIVRAAGVQTPAVPLPSANVWAPASAREPNALWAARPLLVAQPPRAPAPSAVALSIGITHDGDRLPLRAGVYGPIVPVPPAAVWAPSLAREPNSDLRRSIIIAAPWPPIPLAVAQPVGAIRSTPGDRPISWCAVQTFAFPPSAIALTLSAPRDEVAGQPGCPALIQVIAARAAWPAAAPVFVGHVVAPPTDRLAPTSVVGGGRAYPDASVVLLPALRAVAQDHLAPTITIVLPALPSDAIVIALSAPRAESNDRLALTQVVRQAWAFPGATALSAIGISRSEGGLPARVYVVVAASPPSQSITSILRAPRDTPLAQPDRVTSLIVVRAAPPLPSAIAILLHAPFITELYGSLRIAWGAIYPSLTAAGGQPGVAVVAVGPEIGAVVQQPGASVTVVAPSITSEEA